MAQSAAAAILLHADVNYRGGREWWGVHICQWMMSPQALHGQMKHKPPPSESELHLNNNVWKTMPNHIKLSVMYQLFCKNRLFEFIFNPVFLSVLPVCPSWVTWPGGSMRHVFVSFSSQPDLCHLLSYEPKQYIRNRPTLPLLSSRTSSYHISSSDRLLSSQRYHHPPWPACVSVCLCWRPWIC